MYVSESSGERLRDWARIYRGERDVEVGVISIQMQILWDHQAKNLELYNLYSSDVSELQRLEMVTQQLCKYPMFSYAMANGSARSLWPQEEKGIALAWTTWSEDASAGARSIRYGDTGNENDSNSAVFLTWQICHVQFCHDERLSKWFW